MNRYFALLRGMNLGGRRIRNEELCALFEEMGFAEVRAFLASGNIVFDTRARSRSALAKKIEAALLEGLDYRVPTFLRDASELREIAEGGPFRDERGGEGGKPQVLFLPREPDDASRALVLALASDDDRLEFSGSELHWLPAAGISTSELDLRAIEKAVGPTTTRTRNTIERLVAKFVD